MSTTTTTAEYILGCSEYFEIPESMDTSSTFLACLDSPFLSMSIALMRSEGGTHNNYQNSNSMPDFDVSFGLEDAHKISTYTIQDEQRDLRKFVIMREHLKKICKDKVGERLKKFQEHKKMPFGLKSTNFFSVSTPTNPERSHLKKKDGHRERLKFNSRQGQPLTRPLLVPIPEDTHPMETYDFIDGTLTPIRFPESKGEVETRHPAIEINSYKSECLYETEIITKSIAKLDQNTLPTCTDKICDIL